jgi:hypothetical protein
MSDVNLNFVVNNNDISFTVQPNDITFTPEVVDLTFTTGGFAYFPGGAGGNTQITFNDSGQLGGNSAFTFNKNTSNVALNGNLSVSKITSLGAVGNVKITGGTNGYVLQTDGTGNLNWTAQSGGGGNGAPGGANTQVQFNDSGLFGGVAGFTFDTTTSLLTAPFYAGNAASLSAITGANVTGTVANATFATTAGSATSATTAGTVTTAAQPNITSLGTLVSLTVGGTSTIQQALEKVTPNATGATGTINYDILTQAIIQNTSNATGNFTLNFRGNGSTSMDSFMSTNQSATCTYVNKNGTTAYFLSAVQIDGAARTVNWSFGAAPSLATATISGYDVYQFNFIKTASNTYTIYGSTLGYK